MIDDLIGLLDDDNTTNTDLTMTVGTTFQGTLDYPSDQDWVRITLSAGNNYLVKLEGLGTGDGTLADPMISGIMDANGALIDGTTVDNGGDVFGGDVLSAVFNFGPSQTGTYYIAVAEAYDLPGTYSLSVTRDHAGPDLLAGGNQADTIIAEGGRDTVLGNGGDDLIYGNIGLDSLLGGAGDDTLYGGQNSGEPSGEPLAHRDGIETLDGGSGNDLIYGNHGDDSIWAGDGGDLVYGGQNDDLIWGNFGNDQLWGNLGDDQIIGGANRDLLDGGAGDDTLLGGAGTDGFVLGPGSGGDMDRITDFQAGEALILRGVGISALVSAGDDALLTLDSGDKVLFVNADVADIQAALDAHISVADFWGV